MKIGILTYHRSHNYGALLQAIALRKVLSDMGHEVTFIDYWPDYHKHMYMTFSWHNMMARESLRERLSYAKFCLQNFSVIGKRIECFKVFISTYIEPYVSSTIDSYDLIIHGSDQIWRKQPELRWYNPVYFGKHDIVSKRKISYAASMGVLCNTKEEKSDVSEFLSCLNSISVRESDLKSMIENMGYKCYQHVDPTLLLRGEDWVNVMNLQKNTQKKYVLFYNLLPNSFDLNLIKDFACKNNLQLITIYANAEKKNTDSDITTGGPLTFLELVYNASFVFTSSFHGLVFAILFKKEFYASFSTNSRRGASLLNMLGLSERLLTPMSTIPSSCQSIDYQNVDNMLEDLKNNSLDYLKQL